MNRDELQILIEIPIISSDPPLDDPSPIIVSMADAEVPIFDGLIFRTVLSATIYICQ